jgi:ankyrin repeat protein
MGTRKNNKSKKSNKRFRKTRSKKQKGSGANCSRPGQCTTDQNMEEEDPNTIDEYLELAIEEETPRQVKEYLDEGANPNITILDEHEYLQQPENIPAILYTARHIKPSTTILKYLVEKGASVEQDDNTGTTPLIEAAEWGNLPAVRYLLSIGVDINATTGSGISAISYAVMNEDIPMIKLMLDKRKGEIDFNYTILGLDRAHENVIDDTEESEVAKILKKYAIEQTLPKHLERQQNRLQVGRVMDKKRMPGDLTHKIITEHFGGKRKTRKAKKSNKRFKRTGSTQQMGGDNVNAKDANGCTALIRASWDGETEIVAMLLEKGADVNAKDAKGSTALMKASLNGHTEIVRMLMEKGADVNAKDNNRSTALMKAILHRHTEIVRMLLENGADVNVKNGYGSTALVLASWDGETEIMRMLLENGADVNAKDANGSTALIKASLNGHTKVVSMLLEKGADVNAKNNAGNTAFFLANRRGNTEIVKLLKQYIVAQAIPGHLKRQEDRKNLAMVMSEKDVGNRGDGTMPYELRHETEKYLGGKKGRKTRKNYH